MKPDSNLADDSEMLIYDYTGNKSRLQTILNQYLEGIGQTKRSNCRVRRTAVQRGIPNSCKLLLRKSGRFKKVDII